MTASRKKVRHFSYNVTAFEVFEERYNCGTLYQRQLDFYERPTTADMISLLPLSTGQPPILHVSVQKLDKVVETFSSHSVDWTRPWHLVFCWQWWFLDRICNVVTQAFDKWEVGAWPPTCLFFSASCSLPLLRQLLLLPRLSNPGQRMINHFLVVIFILIKYQRVLLFTQMPRQSEENVIILGEVPSTWVNHPCSHPHPSWSWSWFWSSI